MIELEKWISDQIIAIINTNSNILDTKQYENDVNNILYGLSNNTNEKNSDIVLTDKWYENRVNEILYELLKYSSYRDLKQYNYNVYTYNEFLDFLFELSKNDYLHIDKNIKIKNILDEDKWYMYYPIIYQYLFNNYNKLLKLKELKNPKFLNDIRNFPNVDLYLPPEKLQYCIDNRCITIPTDISEYSNVKSNEFNQILVKVRNGKLDLDYNDDKLTITSVNEEFNTDNRTYIKNKNINIFNINVGSNTLHVNITDIYYSNNDDVYYIPNDITKYSFNLNRNKNFLKVEVHDDKITVYDLNKDLKYAELLSKHNMVAIDTHIIEKHTLSTINEFSNYIHPKFISCSDGKFYAPNQLHLYEDSGNIKISKSNGVIKLTVKPSNISYNFLDSRHLYESIEIDEIEISTFI